MGPFTRVVLAIDVDAPQPGRRMVRVLEWPSVRRGVPCGIVLDNGPEPAGRAMDQWAYERGIRLRSIEPGKPAQNAAVEGSNGRLRDGCPNQRRFPSLADARRIVEDWRADYNQVRPHSALGYRSPEEFRLGPGPAAARPQG